jgi:hypothetical protein
MQPKQQRALDLLLTGHATTAFAAEVGVRRETIWRWVHGLASPAIRPVAGSLLQAGVCG